MISGVSYTKRWVLVYERVILGDSYTERLVLVYEGEIPGYGDCGEKAIVRCDKDS